MPYLVNILVSELPDVAPVIAESFEGISIGKRETRVIFDQENLATLSLETFSVLIT